MGIRDRVERLLQDDRAGRESFVLLDGSRYYYDHLEAGKQLFLFCHDVELGRGDDWPEPPEILRKACEAENPAAVVRRFKPQNPRSALVNLHDAIDVRALVRERRSERRIVVLDPEDEDE